MRTHGCSQPSRSKAQALTIAGMNVRQTIEIDRQKFTNRRAVVLAPAKDSAAEHQEPAAPLADELLHQRHLVRREVLGLQIVDDDRVIAIQIPGRFGKPSRSSSASSVPSQHQHRLDRTLRPFHPADCQTRGTADWSTRRIRPRKSNLGSRLAIRTCTTSCTCGSSSIARRRNLNSQFGRPATYSTRYGPPPRSTDTSRRLFANVASRRSLRMLLRRLLPMPAQCGPGRRIRPAALVSVGNERPAAGLHRQPRRSVCRAACPTRRTRVAITFSAATDGGNFRLNGHRRVFEGSLADARDVRPTSRPGLSSPRTTG